MLKELAYKRYCRVHFKILFEAIRNEEHLKMYSLYLNLHSLYRKKSIHNYKSRKDDLAKQFGLSPYMFRKYLNVLMTHGFVWECGKNLEIGSVKNFFPFFGIEKWLGCPDLSMMKVVGKSVPLTNLKKIKNVFFDMSDGTSMTTYQLKTLALEAKERQKAFKYVESRFCRLGLSGKEYSGKQRRAVAKYHIVDKLAKDKKANIFLYLNDIRKLFNLKTNSGASRMLKMLETNKYLKRKHRFVYLAKTLHKDGSVPFDKCFVKNGWVIEQLATELLYTKSLLNEPWWFAAAKESFRRVEQAQKDRIKKLVLIKQGKIDDDDDSIRKISSEQQLDRIISSKSYNVSKRKFKETFVSKETGEVLHTSIYFVVKRLSKNSRTSETYYLTHKCNLDNVPCLIFKEEVTSSQLPQ